MIMKSNQPTMTLTINEMIPAVTAPPYRLPVRVVGVSVTRVVIAFLLILWYLLYSVPLG
jgi:hypothetical protein